MARRIFNFCTGLYRTRYRYYHLGINPHVGFYCTYRSKRMDTKESTEETEMMLSLKNMSKQLQSWIWKGKKEKMWSPKKNAWKPDKRCKYIGHSLGNCVLDVLEGTMPLKCVAEIHSGTCIKTTEELNQVVDDYMEHIWYEFTKDEVMKVVNHVIFEKRFFQIRCQPVHPNVKDGTNGIYRRVYPGLAPRQYRKPLHFNWEKT